MEEPPYNGSPAHGFGRTIHLDPSQRKARCLSLTTGTARLLCSENPDTALYIHQRGRSQCPLRSVD